MSELIRGLHNLRPHHRGCVVTIGNFDGVHLGHQAILTHLHHKSVQYGLPSVIVTFEPLPHEYFLGNKAVPRLTNLRERIRLFAQYGIDRILLLYFNQKLANMEADDFIKQVLVDGLGVRAIFIGDDFRFGRNRAGDFKHLSKSGERYGFEVIRCETYQHGTQRVSSTLIRQALAEGQLETAYKLLGRPYTLSGRVIYGDARGRTIGFPTANLNLPSDSTPLSGVFAVTVTSNKGLMANGVANIGTRPTVDGHRTLLEVHLLSFSGNLYHHHICVSLLYKIRDEQRFESLDALVQQIHCDVDEAKMLLAHSPETNNDGRYS